jgi:cytochrome P450
MSTDTRPTTGSIDLSDGDLYTSGDPEAAWAELRAGHSVRWNARAGGKGFWVVIGYREAVQVLKDTAVFRSEHGMRVDGNPAAAEAAAGKLLIVSDAPRHAKIRKVMGSAFTPRMVARLEQNMRAIVRRELDAVLSAQPCEFTDFAGLLPVSVICDLLGVPRSDWGFMMESTRTAFGESQANPLDRMEAHAAILEYYQYLVESRRQEPGDDVISAMVKGGIDGVPLTDEEIFLNCDGLISGGNETTRHATVGGLLALIRNPDQWRIARDAPGQVEILVNEILRYTSPAMHVLRTTSEDVEVGGQLIRAHEQVAVWLPSANRDETVFDHPARFDVSRTPNNHIALGIGPHHCLGASLARTELRVLFSELLTTVRGAELTGSVRRLHSNLIWGFESLPVSLHW